MSKHDTLVVVAPNYRVAYEWMTHNKMPVTPHSQIVTDLHSLRRLEGVMFGPQDFYVLPGSSQAVLQRVCELAQVNRFRLGDTVDRDFELLVQERNQAWKDLQQ